MLLLGDRVAVQLNAEKEQVLDSGLIVPGDDGIPTKSGLVVALGDNIKSNRLKNDVDKKKDVYVLFDYYDGVKAVIKGKDVVILREEDIIAIL
jgi:chaperonin GroES